MKSHRFVLSAVLLSLSTWLSRNLTRRSLSTN